MPVGAGRKRFASGFAYFGKIADDPTGAKALEQWLEQRDDLLAGRVPRQRGDGLAVGDLVNSFLTDRQRRLDAREITPRTFSEYYKSGGRVIAAFGRNRRVDDLAAEDFATLRAKLAKTRGHTELAERTRFFGRGPLGAAADAPPSPNAGRI
jgi:hypothetical protein